MGWSAHLVSVGSKIRCTSSIWALALLLTACGGGGGGGGSATPQDTTPTSVIVSGSIATVTESSVASQALASEVTVVAVDERGWVADSATTRGDFALTIPTGHDYVIAFRDGTVTGSNLATLEVDTSGSGRALFSLGRGAPDVDLGTLTLHRTSHRAVGSRALADQLPAAAMQPTDTDGDLIPDTMDRDDDNDGVVDASDCAPLDPTRQLLLADGTTCVANDADDDNDGVADASDCAPLDPARQVLAADGTTCVAMAGTATVSGTLLVSTVGQPGETTVSEVEPNDTALTAQFLGPLTTALSYRVNGSLGFLDSQDTFWLTESVGQQVTVTLTHGVGVDFDLQVYDVATDGTLTSLGESTRTTSPDEVVYTTPTPTPGDSFITAIAVLPYTGTGPYELHVQATAPATAAALAPVSTGVRAAVRVAGKDHAPRPVAAVWDVSNLDAEPGEALVKLQPEGAAVHRSSVARRVGLVPCGGVPGLATLLCDTASTAVRASSLTPADLRAAQRRTVARILRLRADPRVAEAIPNYILHPAAVPNDELYPLQWHYPMIGLPAAWDVTTGSANVTVAVLDTGITAHPDLAGRVIAGYDFVSNIGAAGDGDGIDADPTDPGDGDGINPSSWHGTHVAGTIGAATNNGIGVAGIDWLCKIMPVRVLGRGGGSTSDLLNGILYAAGLPNPSGTVPPKQADIINMSLSGADPFEQIAAFSQPVLERVRQAGVLIVAAAGNESTSLPSWPADAAGVLAVSAVNAARTLASYSNFGPTIDLAAPGGAGIPADVNGDGYPDWVLSTLVDNATGQFIYQFDAGTSMAAPHVAGVAALCLAANPTLTVTQLENLLLSTATDLGTPSRDDLYGFGLVNAAAAVQQAANGTPTATLEISPSVLSFGTTDTQLEVALTNTGIATITVAAPTVTTTDGHPWLTAALDPVATTPVVVQVDRTGLAPGRYAGRVTIDSTGGTQVVEVSMEVATSTALPDAGTVFVRLIDPTSATVVQSVQTTQAAGYAYAFSDLPAGRYTLLASTDHDGDGVLCETGDLCGAYPVLNQPVAIEVAAGDTVTGRDFTLTYQGDGVGGGSPPPRSDPNIALLTPLLGRWSFTYTILIPFDNEYTLSTFQADPGGSYLVGSDGFGGVVVADVVTDPSLGFTFSLYDSGTIIDKYFLFNLDGSGNFVSGEYWQIDSVTGDFSPTPYALSGSRLAAAGRSQVTVAGDPAALQREAKDEATTAAGLPATEAHRLAVQQRYRAERGRQ